MAEAGERGEPLDLVGHRACPAGAACRVSTATLSDLASRQRPSNRRRVRGLDQLTGPKSMYIDEGIRLGPLRSRWSAGSGLSPASEGRKWLPSSTRASSNLSNSSSVIWRRAVSSGSRAKQSVLQATNTPQPSLTASYR